MWNVQDASWRVKLLDRKHVGEHTNTGLLTKDAYTERGNQYFPIHLIMCSHLAKLFLFYSLKGESLPILSKIINIRQDRGRCCSPGGMACS
ncbi:hypothetical protein CEXT_341451 [Caerostris extrusa]|uniref:Uncharacterized protein n=1 Tax=Caerostris extrusa TaxID=172846 RepID=A0AAV4NEA1_CAEEX|nr:hypothetical protein CEXT_341451 [Caerostris extrusa]